MYHPCPHSVVSKDFCGEFRRMQQALREVKYDLLYRQYHTTDRGDNPEIAEINLPCGLYLQLGTTAGSKIVKCSSPSGAEMEAGDDCRKQDCEM